MTKIVKIGAKFNSAPISTDNMKELDNFNVKQNREKYTFSENFF